MGIWPSIATPAPAGTRIPDTQSVVSRSSAASSPTPALSPCRSMLTSLSQAERRAVPVPQWRLLDQQFAQGDVLVVAAVATNISGKSGREMLEELIAGPTEAAAMTQLARKRMPQKLPDLGKALSGTVWPHQRFLFAQQFNRIDFFNEAIHQVSAEIESASASLRKASNASMGSPASLNPLPNASSPGSERIWSPSPVPAISYCARACLLGTTRERADAGAAGPATPTSRLNSQIRRPPRAQEGRYGRGPQYSDHHLPHAHTRHLLPRPWPSLLRPA